MAKDGAQVRRVTGGGGAGIAYRVAGPVDARALVLLHGWAQQSRSWGAEVIAGLAADHRVIAIDLRGHGASDAPETGYDDPELWAGDVRAVLGAEGLGPGAGATLVGWSYGGLVACDVLGQSPDLLTGGVVTGLVLVGAITAIGRGRAGGRIGPAMRAALPAALSTDPTTALGALTRFTADLVPGDGAMTQALLGAALSTPPRVRAALFDREADHDRLLAGLEIDVLVVHADDDTVVDPAAGAHAAALAPRARRAAWPTGGHAPFLSDPPRFVAEITEFAAALAPAAAGARPGAGGTDG